MTEETWPHMTPERRWACLHCGMILTYVPSKPGPFRFDDDLQQQVIDRCPGCARSVWTEVATK